MINIKARIKRGESIDRIVDEFYKERLSIGDRKIEGEPPGDDVFAGAGFVKYEARSKRHATYVRDDMSLVQYTPKALILMFDEALDGECGKRLRFNIASHYADMDENLRYIVTHRKVWSEEWKPILKRYEALYEEAQANQQKDIDALKPLIEASFGDCSVGKWDFRSTFWGNAEGAYEINCDLSALDKHDMADYEHISKSLVGFFEAMSVFKGVYAFLNDDCLNYRYTLVPKNYVKDSLMQLAAEGEPINYLAKFFFGKWLRQGPVYGKHYYMDDLRRNEAELIDLGFEKISEVAKETGYDCVYRLGDITCKLYWRCYPIEGEFGGLEVEIPEHGMDMVACRPHDISKVINRLVKDYDKKREKFYNKIMPWVRKTLAEYKMRNETIGEILSSFLIKGEDGKTYFDDCRVSLRYVHYRHIIRIYVGKKNIIEILVPHAVTDKELAELPANLIKLIAAVKASEPLEIHAYPDWNE